MLDDNNANSNSKAPFNDGCPVCPNETNANLINLFYIMYSTVSTISNHPCNIWASGNWLLKQKFILIHKPFFIKIKIHPVIFLIKVIPLLFQNIFFLLLCFGPRPLYFIL